MDNDNEEETEKLCMIANKIPQEEMAMYFLINKLSVNDTDKELLFK